MKRIVILGWYGHSNSGDEAILDGIVENLQGVIDDDLEFTVLSSAPENVEKQHHVKSINYPASLKNNPEIIRVIKNADLFILGGGGLLQEYHRSHLPLGLMYYLAPVIIAKLLRKPAVTYAIGIGPIHSKLGRFITKIVLNRINLITVRDERSKMLLDSIGINKPPGLCDNRSCCISRI